MTGGIAVWLLMGVVGGVMLWRLDKRNITKNMTWCPTPRAILLIMLGSVFGLCLLGAAVLIWTLELITLRGRDSWFTRPICGKKEV